jgi:hypothetical protein
MTKSLTRAPDDVADSRKGDQAQQLSALKKDDEGDDEKMRDSDQDLREDTDDQA